MRAISRDKVSGENSKSSHLLYHRIVCYEQVEKLYEIYS